MGHSLRPGRVLSALDTGSHFSPTNNWMRTYYLHLTVRRSGAGKGVHLAKVPVAGRCAVGPRLSGSMAQAPYFSHHSICTAVILQFIGYHKCFDVFLPHHTANLRRTRPVISRTVVLSPRHPSLRDQFSCPASPTGLGTGPDSESGQRGTEAKSRPLLWLLQACTPLRHP